MRHKGLTGWRYDCKCNYMITLVTEPRRGVFGELREWGVERNALGKAVYDAWQSVERRFPGVRATYNAIMPDHFHGIVYMAVDGAANLEEVVAWFAAEAERLAGRRLWNPLWRDSICLGRGQLDRQIYYVLSNAKRRWIKEHNPGLFRKLLGFRHWRLERTEASLAGIEDADHWNFRAVTGRPSGEEGRECWELESGEELMKPRKANVKQTAFATGKRQQADNKSGRLSWTAMGNPFLLDEQLLVSVRISRFAAPGAAERAIASLRQKAERGAVLVGAFVSSGEKAAKTAVIEAGGKVVQLLAEGMGRYFKPGGRDFDLCSEGRMLVMSPFAVRAAGVAERDNYGKPRFEWLNLAAEAIADLKVNVGRAG